MKQTEYITHTNQEEMNIANTNTDLIQNESLASVFSFLAFIFTVTLIGLLISLVFNLSAPTKLILLSSLGLSLISGVGVNWLDKRILLKNSEKQLEKLLQNIE